MKLVSVIVLAYCSEDTILETLNSIKEQTYQEIELIVTDDCSPDHTVQVVNQWIEENGDRFVSARCLSVVRNTGLPTNFNRGLSKAHGEYFKGIAGDDILSPNAIEKYVAFCEENPNKWPIGKVHLFRDQDQNPSYPEIQKYCENCYKFAMKDYKQQYKMLLIKNRIVAPSATFYKTEVVRKLGGYDKEYPWFEDYPMNLKLMHAGYGFGFIDEELVWYRMSDKSVTASQQKRLKKTEAKLFLKRKFWYMFQNGMGWEAIKQCKYWSKILFMK